MNPSLRLCAHLASDRLARLAIRPDDALDWWHGPVLAVARCDRCDGAALLDLVDWIDGGRVRLFAVSAIDAGAVALHARNVRHGSCDVARAPREIEALVASAGPPERLVARDEDGAVVRSAAWPAGAVVPSGEVAARLARAEGQGLRAALGLG